MAAEDDLNRLAGNLVAPAARHAKLAEQLLEPHLSPLGNSVTPRLSHLCVAVLQEAKKVGDGNLATLSDLLTAQALSLDGLFTELARIARKNLADHPQAAESYMRLALKAQTASRATVAELVKLHQPREQIVKHVQVNHGGKAVVADHFHQHQGEHNGKPDEQSHATGTAGKSTQVLGQDPPGHDVPVSGGEGAQAMPNARRDQSRRA